MSVVGSVTVPLAKSSGHEPSGNKSPSPQCVKGKEALKIDGNDLGQAIVSGVSQHLKIIRVSICRLTLNDTYMFLIRHIIH